MADGTTHDKAGLIASIILLPINPTIALGCFCGFMWLSPDLDCEGVVTRPQRRWGPLWSIWLPYEELIPKHRSPLSHGPILGTVIRLGYLGWPFVVLRILNGPDVLGLLSTEFWVAFTLGVEANGLLHLAMDLIWSEGKQFRKRWGV